MTDFSSLLNPEQFAAATAGNGPLLVLAAAGTGKTRTLVHRVAYLIENGVSPDRILLLTFTNRAAREMRERAAGLVGADVESIWSGTFHSICARLLRRYGQSLGYQPNFQIIDEDDQKKLIAEAIKNTAKNPRDFPKKEIIAKIISEAANEEKTVEAVAARWQTKAAGIEPEEIAKVAAAYDARKRALSAMDFDDLLIKGLELLKKNDRVGQMLQEHFLHVLVDEYQDTNGLQAEFTDILAQKHRNILAVGDDFQCIYTWRGAKIENILDFPSRWSGCRIIKLERNYRSRPGVLDVANAVMKDAPSQFDKTLRPFRADDGMKPSLVRVYDGKAQASEIYKLVFQAISSGRRCSDIAILYRSHFQSIDIQMELARAKVPFRITSGVGVFEQAHTKDLLSYLRLVLNPGDELSFMRLMTLLPGVGDKSAASYWNKLGGRFSGSEDEYRDQLGSMLGAKARPIWPQLAECFANADSHLSANSTGELVKEFIDRFYRDYAHKEWEEPDASDRIDDLNELATQITGGVEELEAFLADVALLTNLDVNRDKGDTNRVTLSTVHQAKGMEWPVVFIPWLSEGMFPSAKAAEEGRCDEERRLFYVAVTRAKDELTLFAPMVKRTPEGGMFPVEPSIFVKEVPKELMNIRRTYTPMQNLGYGNSSYGYSRSGYSKNPYSSSYGSSYKPKPKPTYTTTWRR